MARWEQPGSLEAPEGLDDEGLPNVVPLPGLSVRELLCR